MRHWSLRGGFFVTLELANVVGLNPSAAQPPSVVSWKYVAFRFDQMVMIGRLREGANTGRIGPFAQATEGAIWSNPQGGPKRGDRRVAEWGPYRPVWTRVRALRSSPLRSVAMPRICGTGH